MSPSENNKISRIIVDWLILAAIFFGGIAFLMWYMTNILASSDPGASIDPKIPLLALGLIMASISFTRPHWVTLQIVRSSRGDKDQKHPLVAALIMFFLGLGIATGSAIYLIFHISQTVDIRAGTKASGLIGAICYSMVIEGILLWRPVQRLIQKNF